MKRVLVIEIVEGSFGYGPKARLFRATVKGGRALSRSKWETSTADFEFSPAAELTIAEALESAACETLRHIAAVGISQEVKK